jgi:hypothetical protein
VLHIFSLLPVDCRLRCAEVCCGWRSVLLERSLWSRLDLSHASGVRMPQAYPALDALLRCAAARAGGGLQALHIVEDLISDEALLEVVAANAGALHELRAHTHVDNAMHTGFIPEVIEAVLVAAPLLRVFNTDLCCGMEAAEDARRVLRNEPPFGRCA